MLIQLYTIECLQGAPLSTWDDPTPLDELLDRYHEQWNDQSDGDHLTREQFTAELFQDLFECRLHKAGKRITVLDMDTSELFVKNPWHKGKGVKLINIAETLPF